MTIVAAVPLSLARLRFRLWGGDIATSSGTGEPGLSVLGIFLRLALEDVVFHGNFRAIVPRFCARHQNRAQ